MTVARPQYERCAVLCPCKRFACKIVVAREFADFFVAFERFVEQLFKQLPLTYVQTAKFNDLRKKIYPFIDFGGAVVGVYERGGEAVGRRDDVYFFIIIL